MTALRNSSKTECFACHKADSDERTSKIVGKPICTVCAVAIKDGLTTVPPKYFTITPRKAEFAAGMPFLTLLGACGTRKTVTACHLLRATAWQRGLVPMFVSTADLFSELGSVPFENKRAFLMKRAKAQLLLLDDLAAEKQWGDSKADLGMIIEYRGGYDLPTIYTTNLTLNELGSVLGDRIANRLKRYGPVKQFA